MDEHRALSLSERVERLERDAEDVRNELRLVNRKLDRALSGLEQGGVDAEAGIATPPASDERSAVERPVLRFPETERQSRPPQRPASRPAAASHEPPRQREERQDHTPGAGRSFGLPFDLGNLRSGEWWLSRIGIGLLLLGVAFLYSPWRGVGSALGCAWASASLSAPRYSR